MDLELHHVALRVADVQRALGFYAGLLGLPEHQRFPHADGSWRSVWLRAGRTILMLELELKSAGPREGSGHLLAFAVGDLAEWEQRLDAARVTIVERTTHTLYVNDPDGHRVGLSSFPRDPAPATDRT